MSSRSPIWFNLLIVVSLLVSLVPAPRPAYGAVPVGQAQTETPPPAPEASGVLDSPLPPPDPPTVRHRAISLPPRW